MVREKIITLSFGVAAQGVSRAHLPSEDTWRLGWPAHVLGQVTRHVVLGLDWLWPCPGMSKAHALMWGHDRDQLQVGPEHIHARPQVGLERVHA